MSSVSPITVSQAQNQVQWDSFLSAQRYRPFLQSWTMGEVYRDTRQEPIRLEVRENGEIVAICQAILVPAKRGRHLAIPYGPILGNQKPETRNQILEILLNELVRIGKEHHCSFIRMSPFWPETQYSNPQSPIPHTLPSPLHLLAEHVWYLPLVTPDPWQQPETRNQKPETAGEEALLAAMRKTTRNLIRRAEKDGVEIVASANPVNDVGQFIALHEETRKRHHFTPYTNTFFRSQVTRFAARGECTVYLARYQGEVAAASIHIHAFGETSYHHGASTSKFAKIPASYLLQWTAICDALKRGDHVYNFWGIAPVATGEDSKTKIQDPKHPFAGVTLFKTGFGGNLLPLVHCMDFPLTRTYTFTRLFEQLRKWRRGF
ncbi:MAG: peptidoglycan bridge formation glycyltransferase FemA/FemB family protein [Candidatus Peribacteraceae bacterium]|nr:peptidoglycan bridge formation glycyltransferase FemA/FemB family protein [Candidatus Peribacteraceae bacterium]